MMELVAASKIYTSVGTALDVLKNIHLTIEDGEMIAITGPSGTGKSTLLNILGCLDNLTSGEYRIDSRPTAGLSQRSLAHLRNETFGFVFQFFGLISEYTTCENVMLPLLYRGLSIGQARGQATGALHKIGIKELADKYPHQLSGGQQQRVAVARAIVGEPKVVLADEPTGSLDATARADVLQLLKDLHHAGHTIIVVTHSDEVSRHCPRVLRISDGKITEQTA